MQSLMTGNEKVSIRAPREGGDTGRVRLLSFQYVSIRAPREGGDTGA